MIGTESQLHSLAGTLRMHPMFRSIWRRFLFAKKKQPRLKPGLRVRPIFERLEDRFNPSTTLNPLNGGLQIVIAGADTVTLSTANGALVVSDATSGQTITDNTAKFTLNGTSGRQQATENAALITDFSAITITGTGSGQSVLFNGGFFVATNVNDGTISSVAFNAAPSYFSGDVNMLTATSLTLNASISGTGAINITVAGVNLGITANANITSQGGPINLQATGNVNIGQNVSIISSTNTISLSADMTPAGNGDDGVGVVNIGAGDDILGTKVNLRGADVQVDPSATFGSKGILPPAFLSGLNHPIDMAVDRNGNLFVGDGVSIKEFAPGSTVPTRTLTGLKSGAGDLVFDQMGNLYVCDGSVVSVFAPGSTTPTAELTGLTDPFALAVDSKGDLFVLDRELNTIFEFKPGSTKPSASFPLPDDGPFGSSFFCLAIDNNDNIYAGDIEYGDIVKIDPQHPANLIHLTGAMNPDAMAFDASGNLYVANGNSGDTITKYAPGGISPSATLTGVLNSTALAFDSQGNLFVSNLLGITEFKPGATSPAVTFGSSGYVRPSIVSDSTGDLYVSQGAVAKYTFNPPTISSVTIRSSIPSRPMSLGGSNDSVVAGINMTSAALARIFTAPTGTVTFGDSNQTGNITFHTATRATTSGASTVVMQSITGPGQIILDDGQGAATALNGNGGTVSLTSGTGGIQALSAPNNIAEIANASTVSLTSGAGIGTTQPLELNVTNLTTDTTAANGNQFLNSLGTVSASLNSGTGTINLAGNGTFQLAGNSFSASALVNNGTITSSVTIGSGQTLTGDGKTGPINAQSGGTLNSGSSVSTLALGSISLQPGSNFNAVLNSTSNYTQDVVVATGTVNLAGANLVLSGSLTPANGQTFTIINNSGTQPVSGTFNGLPEGAIIPNFLGSSLIATISYKGGDGNDVVLTVVQQVATTTTVSAPSNSAIYGQSIAFTATVTTSSTSNQGSMQTVFSDLGAGLSWDHNNSYVLGDPTGSGTLANGVKAMEFTASQTVPLTTIELPLGSDRNVASIFDVRLMTDKNGQPGNTLESFQVSNLPILFSSSQDLTICTSKLHPMLVAKTKYWITISPGSKSSSGGWYVSLPSQEGTVAFSPDGGISWTLAPYGNNQLAAFAIFGGNITPPNPVGQVEFFDDSTNTDLGPGTLTGALNGTATWTLTTAPGQLQVTGTEHTIRARFISSGNFGTSSGTLVGGETITPAPLTITAVPNTRAYDGTTSAAAVPLITGTVFGTDTPNFIETYDTPDVGTGKTLTPSGSVNDGNGGNDYSYSFVSANTGVITPPTVSITVKNGYNSITEPVIGTRSLYYFTISLSVVYSKPVIVWYSTKDGSATAGEDFIRMYHYQVYFPANTHGSTLTTPPSRNIAVTIKSDASDGQNPETFSVVLDAARNAIVDPNQQSATATIVQRTQAALPVVNIADFTAPGPNTGSTVFDIPITLSGGPSDQSVTIFYSTSNGTASAGLNFVNIGHGELTIPAGKTGATIYITVLADPLANAGETFTITLFNPLGAVLGTSTATVTIA